MVESVPSMHIGALGLDLYQVKVEYLLLNRGLGDLFGGATLWGGS